MKFVLSKSLFRPFMLAIAFVPIPIILALSYPASFWAIGDYEPHSLANALNMAYRLADMKMHPAMGMSNHPGVPFYFTSWLALALTGHPLGSDGVTLLNKMEDQVETFHLMMIFLGSLAGATGIFVFARLAQQLVPFGVLILGLALWLFSAPATIFTFYSPGMESFALLINALFFALLVRIAWSQALSETVVILAGFVGAIAYLNKLSYLYIPAALVTAIVVNLVLDRADRGRATRLVLVFIISFLSAVLVAAVFIIGWPTFRDLLVFHKQVIFGSGLYGAGDKAIVSGSAVWNTLMAVPANRAYAIPIALLSGVGLGIGGLLTAAKKPGQNPVAIFSIGAAVATSLSALAVLKHYTDNYVAAVSATLPVCAVASYLLAKAWAGRFEFGSGVVISLAASLSVYPVAERLANKLTFYSQLSRQAGIDMQEIAKLMAESKRATYFTYRSPFVQFGEGFVIDFASVPRLTESFLESRPGVLNTLTASKSSREQEVGIYVIDKRYFASADLVQKATNLDLLGLKAVRYQEDDRLVELRTVFLLVRK